jgi:ABC-type lipoprotein export system ATPase subunit
MNDPQELLLEAEDLGLAYGPERVLAGVSLQVRPGTITTIVGPSGCGKTTLLNLLALLLAPTSGKIRVRGEDAAALSDAKRAKLRNEFLGPIFQAPHLIGSLSVLDNVLVPAFISGCAREKRAAAEGWLVRLGLGERKGHLPHMLSVGQKRRVSIARALIMRPAVVLADEPTNDLDEFRSRQVIDFLLNLTNEGYALVLVTHDAQLASKAGNRWRIRDKRLERWTENPSLGS